MCTILPVRKLIKLVSTKRVFAKRDRLPTSLHEGLDKNVAERSHWQTYLFILIILIIYFIHSSRFHYNTNKNYVYLPTFISSEEAIKNSPLKGPAQTLPVCSVDVQKFGNFSVNKSVTEIPEKYCSGVQRGGYYTPEECRSRHKVAVLVPYRNRAENLVLFLFNIHPFLMKQKLEYRIFIIEQKGTELFNRGQILNAGFKEAKKYGKWTCMVLHDVDLLPLDERILYSCPIWPRHMCAAIIEITRPRFHTFFGGVSAITQEHFEKVNGFSNLYRGWGGEDTDLFLRIRSSGLPIVRYNRKIAKYTALNHTTQVANIIRFDLLHTATKRYPRDGLSSLDYTVDSVTLHHLYTHILINVNPTNENITENKVSYKVIK